MLFSVISKAKSQKIQTKNKSRRKGERLFLGTEKKLKTSIITSLIASGMSPMFHWKRVTSCISSNKMKRLQGSVTVEAALVVPIFLYAVLCVVYLLEILATQMVVRTNMDAVYQELSQEMYLVSYISGKEVEEEMIAHIGVDRLEQSMIVGGSSGLDCSASYASLVTGILTLQVDYKVSLPFPQFVNLGLSFSETLSGKG